MNVSVYSRIAITELIKSGFPKNVSVVSFYNPVGRLAPGRFRVDYGQACDNVFYVGIPDIDEGGFEENGYNLESFFLEVDDLAKFIIKAVTEGHDIICQCDFGRGRSAACAAAILDHFEGRGNEIFTNDIYSPNMTVYKKVLDALSKKRMK